MPNFNNRSCSWLSLISVMWLTLTCIGLSYWQLQRYEYKKTWQLINTSNNRQSPMDKLPPALSNAYEGRSFKTKAIVHSELAFLRDNKYFQHKAGYLLYLPVEINDNWYLGEFGWISKKGIMPKVKLASVSGHVVCPKGKEFLLKKTPNYNQLAKNSSNLRP